MKRWVSLLMVIGLFAIILSACGQKGTQSSDQKSTSEQSLTISVAASLTDVTKALEKAFHEKYPHIDVSFNYGGSGALREQIDKGAPVDVFMSANTKDVDMLKEKGKVQHTYDYAHNKLVLIHRKGSDIQSIDQLGNNDQLAIGEVKSVPAGKYAKTYLEDQNKWSSIEDRIVYAKDVREVLNYVNKGNAKLGFVYQTDLYVGTTPHTGVEKVSDAPLKSPIVYRMGTVTDTEAANAWYDFMKSNTAQRILKDYHFEK
ncbi:molybdate ABC transporter substrate-binding protein [Staphylococcus delphini]|uniref:Molybdate ABC transporter substrate-binding protein n=1 Tax=Staphylococcus delphini TaxID=53344 RepID=A0A2A4GZM1_9STAP|nr:molybdate ABC transporter substrate-binding protein [Staphylococcus delphini]PCF56433.1 molybdate ABC transporter substrate-binding protein [Staphylococcus delphini]PCF63347.1 molybdate ABC transporter substrate-binding protein [Staphylococcus delphini]PCF73489.1 molybdate ABC transporter substrate-binding protein [Staphylococcus delphini]HEC2157334.1 molybdate ABC transporter substrate-binding protein [Staphylococcus delphini]